MSASNLEQALKILALDWQQTKIHWRDAKARQFEEKYLEELPHAVARASAAMDELGKLLRKVKEDCE